MHSETRSHNSIVGVSWGSANTSLGIMITLLLLIFLILIIMLTAQPAQGQNYTVIHNFTGAPDGADPLSGLTIDPAGNFYGTTCEGGWHGAGTIFKLKRSGVGWDLTYLHSLYSSSEGACPAGRVALAHDGTLFGTAYQGAGRGCQSRCGTVFHLTSQTPFEFSVLHTFDGEDGGGPVGDLTFDQAGNLYGTANIGGSYGYGVTYELTVSGGGWAETVLYSAQGDGDGSTPWGGVVFDTFGNLYGVFTGRGPHKGGAVYELSPSGTGWTEQTVYGFTGLTDGRLPQGGLIVDSSGNLYGTTLVGGRGSVTGSGTVFKLAPNHGSWNFTTLYKLSGHAGSEDKLIMDAAGNLYGTTYEDGAYHWGSVFELSPSSGGWIYTTLHDFCVGGYPCSDGSAPVSSLVFDANGNLYGTTSSGGAYGHGVVFEITP